MSYRPHPRHFIQVASSLRAQRLCVKFSDSFPPSHSPSSPIFRIFFQVPYPATPLFATSCENCRGVYQRFPNRNVPAQEGWNPAGTELCLLPERKVLYLQHLCISPQVLHKRLTASVTPLSATLTENGGSPSATRHHHSSLVTVPERWRLAS